MKHKRLRDKLESGTPVVMGVLNVTPDSFSEEGRNFSLEQAVKSAREMVEAGADIIDIGGESTRPGAAEVNPEEEQKRVLPVLEEIKKLDTIISLDTRNASTMREGLNKGVDLINDVTALTGDPDSLGTVADSEAFICLMHMQGKPQTMQKNPTYQDVVDEIISFLRERIEACAISGISRDRLIVDPGIGFGKTLEHNLEIFKDLNRFQELDVPVLLGASRKSFIEKICGEVNVDLRLPGSLAACLWGLEKGARIFRVHDVPETIQALDVWRAISGRWTPLSQSS